MRIKMKLKGISIHRFSFEPSLDIPTLVLRSLKSGKPDMAFFKLGPNNMHT